MKKLSNITFIVLFLLIISSQKTVYGVTGCLNGTYEAVITLQPNPVACDTEVNIVIQSHDTIIPGVFETLNIFRITKGSSDITKVGELQVSDTTTPIGPFEDVTTTGYDYKIFLGDDAQVLCSNEVELTQNCTPTPIPTSPVPCRAINLSCRIGAVPPDADACCQSPAALTCTADASGGNATCLTNPNPPTATPAPTDFPTYDPCSGFSIDGAGAAPAPGYEEEYPACKTCHDSNGTYTALGCIPNDPSQFTSALIRVLFAISGGIAFLIILYGAFLCLTSRGSTERTQACRETITAAIVGLLLILFSLFIVRVLFNERGIFTNIIPTNLF